MIERRYVVDCDGCQDRLSGVYYRLADADRARRASEWQYRRVKRNGKTARVLHCKRCAAE